MKHFISIGGEGNNGQYVYVCIWKKVNFLHFTFNTVQYNTKHTQKKITVFLAIIINNV